jgi:hypothetical protein
MKMCYKTYGNGYTQVLLAVFTNGVEYRPPNWVAPIKRDFIILPDRLDRG